LLLQKEGQSVWLDFIRRNLITSGELKRLIDQDGLRGITSNPSIFEKAITGSTDYTNFRQQLQFVNVGKPGPWRKWPDAYAPGHIRQDERLAQQLRSNPADDRRPKHVREVTIKNVGFTHLRVLRPRWVSCRMLTLCIIYNLKFLTRFGVTLK